MNEEYWNRFKEKQRFAKALELEELECVNEYFLEQENSEDLQKELDGV